MRSTHSPYGTSHFVHPPLGRLGRVLGRGLGRVKGEQKTPRYGGTKAMIKAPKKRAENDEATIDRIEAQQQAARDARDAEDRLFWADFLANEKGMKPS